MKEDSQPRIENTTSKKVPPLTEHKLPSQSEIDDLFEKERKRLQKEKLSKKPDSLSQQEDDALEKERKRLLNISFQQDIEERKKYADKIYKLIVGWLIAIFLLVLINGFCSAFDLFSLSTAVMTTIVGGTTVNILGIFYIVANYIFHRPK